MANIKRMIHFEEWAKHKSFLIKTAALLLVLFTENFLEALEKIKARERIEGDIPLPPVNEWLKLYRGHRKVYRGVTNSFRQISSEVSDVIDFYELLMCSFDSLNHITQSEFQEALDELAPEEQNKIIGYLNENLKGVYDLIIEDYLEESEVPKAFPNKTAKEIQKVIYGPEMIFFLRIWVPCFFLYGDYPPYLLRKARQGYEEALEKLLRLDKSVLDDPKIMEIFHKASVASANGKMTLITKALQNTPRAKIDIQRIKYLFGGLLSLISIAIGQKLTAAEINKLFDAVARDTSGELVDSDFIVTPETFEKGIQRARDFWKIPIPLPDKK